MPSLEEANVRLKQRNIALEAENESLRDQLGLNPPPAEEACDPVSEEETVSSVPEGETVEE